jgi:3-dehydroquinate synthase
MVMATALSSELGLVPASFVVRVRALIARAGLPVQAPPMPMARWFELMRVDKKAADGEIRFVLIESIGRAAVRTAPDAVVQRIIAAHTAPPAPA